MNIVKRKKLLIAAIALIALVGFYGFNKFGAAHAHGEEDSHHVGEHNDDHAEEGHITLSKEQIAASDIVIALAGSGNLAREVSVSGQIIAAADRMAHIAPKLGGTVTEARKNLGDTVEKGEVMALIESREMAEAVAEHQAASRSAELARANFAREKNLWDKKITAEQDYLIARNANQEAAIRLDLSKQKLQALGHNGASGKSGNSRFHELRAPLSGRVIARELTLGEYVDSTRTAYSVADLSIVWLEIAIAPSDLAFVKEGQSAFVTAGGDKTEGKLIFVSPAIDSETRTAKAIIELDNAAGLWRPGAFANATIATSTQELELLVPKEAIQTIEGKPAVFVQTDSGFEKREVSLGREDSRYVEILSGLTAGEPIAISNSFTLKAELGKAEAEHAH